MELKQKKWWRKTASVALIVSMTATPGTPAMAAPPGRCGHRDGNQPERDHGDCFNEVEGWTH